MKKKDINKMPDIELQGWNIRELVEQASNKDADEIFKEVLSGGKTKEGSKLPDISAYEIDSQDKERKEK